MEQSSESILKNKSLKITANRVEILNVFAKHPFALSYNDLESHLDAKLDKVTVYRTLKAFEKAGLIHEVMDNSAVIKYALCNHSKCNHVEHTDSHLHFKCTSCTHIFCLDSVQHPTFNLPKGYLVENISILVEGICNNCSQKNRS